MFQDVEVFRFCFGSLNQAEEIGYEEGTRTVAVPEVSEFEFSIWSLIFESAVSGVAVVAAVEVVVVSAAAVAAESGHAGIVNVGRDAAAVAAVAAASASGSCRIGSCWAALWVHCGCAAAAAAVAAVAADHGG